ncbi:MAG: class II fructose-bisphosphate aldolase [Ardenticatenaceae bacterium]|nr:class II fructose-bisphosphate aldolase [Ardenticatenaceae bacterium]
MTESSADALLKALQGAIEVSGETVNVVNEQALRGEAVDRLVWNAVFGDGVVRDVARWILWEAGQALGICPSSIHDLYMARGAGQVRPTFTVPAINVRGMAYTTGRAIFRAARRLNVSALLLEIARSEIGYTGQRPAEYVAVMLGAAIKEGFRGPLFIQGDHFQISARGYKSDPEKEIGAVKDLMKEAIEAGFYNLDIDTSTLVDLDHPTLDEQQRTNYELCARLTAYVRELEPEGINVSLGGEIGEVGGKNSTVEELHAFMQGYNRTLTGIYPGLPGISKISVQTGTSHGGVVLPDGTLAQVKVDFDALARLSRVAREKYHLGGAVQHGASTLPESAFGKFPECETVEIHLATGFQNTLFELCPEELRQEAFEYCNTHLSNERKTGQTDEQFFYSTRKKTLGPMKARWWNLPAEVENEIGRALEQRFAFLFEQLRVNNTRDLVARTVTPFRLHRPRPQAAVEHAGLEIAHDLSD